MNYDKLDPEYQNLFMTAIFSDRLINTYTRKRSGRDRVPLYTYDKASKVEVCNLLSQSTYKDSPFFTQSCLNVSR